MTDKKYTVVQHSGYGISGKPGFMKGLEPVSVTAAQEKTVLAGGGLLFATYTEADEFCDKECYPASNTGMYPEAPGHFAKVKVTGLALYCPLPQLKPGVVPAPVKITRYLTEPPTGSVLLADGLTGTAWQRFFSDGLWHSVTGKSEPWRYFTHRDTIDGRTPDYIVVIGEEVL